MLEYYDAIARVEGSAQYPEIYGTVKFLENDFGSWVQAELFGLPDYVPESEKSGSVGPFAFHVHEFDTCGALYGDTPFLGAGGHFNPFGEPAGNQPGDFPLLFSNNGTAKMMFFTSRFRPQEVIGKSVVIHQGPALEGGLRIACGRIEKAF